MQVSVGDRVVALASERDVFRRGGVVAGVVGELAVVELDAGGEEVIGTEALAGRVVEESTGARRCERFTRAGWYLLINAMCAA